MYKVKKSPTELYYDHNYDWAFFLTAVLGSYLYIFLTQVGCGKQTRNSAECLLNKINVKNWNIKK